jgi:tetratricopeptide (TPR) repeat protein
MEKLSAWQLRESGHTPEALALFTSEYLKAESSSNWQGQINLLIDLHICWKNLAKENPDEKMSYLNTSESCLDRVLEISEKQSLPLIPDFYFYQGGLYLAKGEYAQAEDVYNKFLEKNTQLSEAQTADTMAHIGFAMAKQGKSGGIDKIKKSISVLENLTEPFVHQEVEVSAIWLTGAYILLSRVQENKDDSKATLTKALEIAKAKNLGARINQIENLLKS